MKEVKRLQAKIPDNGKVNPLFDDLTYNTSERYGNCSYFTSPLLEEITSNSQISPRVICQSIELGACLEPIVYKHERDL